MELCGLRVNFPSLVAVTDVKISRDARHCMEKKATSKHALLMVRGYEAGSKEGDDENHEASAM